jgi:hypothetical protein
MYALPKENLLAPNGFLGFYPKHDGTPSNKRVPGQEKSFTFSHNTIEVDFSSHLAPARVFFSLFSDPSRCQENEIRV